MEYRMETYLRTAEGKEVLYGKGKGDGLEMMHALAGLLTGDRVPLDYHSPGEHPNTGHITRITITADA